MEDNFCERCDKLSREDLCNLVGDYRCCIAEIEAILDGTLVSKRPKLELIEEALKDLEECLHDNR